MSEIKGLLVMDVDSTLVQEEVIDLLVIYRDKLADADNWRGHINNFYIVLFFVMLLYLNAISKEKLEKEIICWRFGLFSKLFYQDFYRLRKLSLS